ncbi:MAG: hypothetical protein IIC74_00610, partial [Bacteroidetes bacterium]|nr:hypothetical protein [Bacteroidota bacterium]
KAQEAFLESLVLPGYKGIHVEAPHLARISILKMLDVIGTIRDIDFTYLAPYQAAGNPEHGHSPIPTGYPYQIDVNFTFHGQNIILDRLDALDDNINIYEKTLLGELGQSKFII